MMKTAGIIAEYNPFHNGHQYHIEQTRDLTGAEYIIAVISGCFVQRGAPAVTDPYVRTEMALKNGADLVIALPVTGSVASAGDFAASGIHILKKLGTVDFLSFGCEAESDDEKKLLSDAAVLLADEPDRFRSLLQDALRQGVSWPAARTNAAAACLTEEPAQQEKIIRLLSSPNNILALEYLRILSQEDTGILPCMVPRKGDSYHSEMLPEDRKADYLSGSGTTENDTSSVLPSATAVRNLLLSGFDDRIMDAVPDTAYELLQEYAQRHRFLSENDFSDLLYAVLCRLSDDLQTRFPYQGGLAATVSHSLEQFTNWQEYALHCKGKHLTYTSVSRYLTRVLLDLDAETAACSAAFGHAPYARILGFRKSASPLLKEIAAHATIPVITKPAEALRTLPRQERHLFSKDISAANVYRYFARASVALPLSDLRQPLICL